jgi:hypothetical protein
MLAYKHSDVLGMGSFDKKWFTIYTGIFLVLMKFIFSVYSYFKSEKFDTTIEEMKLWRWWNNLLVVRIGSE